MLVGSCALLSRGQWGWIGPAASTSRTRSTLDGDGMALSAGRRQASVRRCAPAPAPPDLRLDDAREERDALADRLRAEHRKGQCDRLRAATVEMKHLAARVRDAARDGRPEDGVRIDARWEPEPDRVSALRPAEAAVAWHRPRERVQHRREPLGVDVAHAPQMALQRAASEESGERGFRDPAPRP